MDLVDTFVAIAITVLIPPFLGIFIVALTLASFGKSLGVRQLYVKLLLRLFEFGKQRIAQSLASESDRNDDDDVFTDSVPVSKIIFESRDNMSTETHEFQLSDCVDYIRPGISAIVDDEVTKRFSAEELPSWNFLTRTNCHYEFISIRLTILWVIGFIVRYFILFPVRLLILMLGINLLVCSMFVVGCIPEGAFKRKVSSHVFKACFRIICRSYSGVVYYHNVENRPKSDGICVANHTSPIDCVTLACDACFSFVGQRHGGFLSIFQRALSRASSHIWFERGEAKDRFAVARRLKEHVEDPNKLPILIFPEGTCINNTSVMQFKKGTFEVGSVIYPVAIKYDPRFGDAFWNSSKYSMINYLYMMMTSWAIVCDVWYLPPMRKRDNETSIEFANRVKAEIARQGGLVDLVWDGALKRSAPKKEWKEQYQHEFSKRLKILDVDNEKKQEKAE